MELNELYSEGIDIIFPLAERFVVPVPQLVFKLERNPSFQGKYKSEHNLIEMYSKNLWKDVLLHEFAHHVDHCRNGVRKTKKKQVIYHDKVFAALLWDIATVQYGNPLEYRWDLEYRSLRGYPEWRRQKQEEIDNIKRRILLDTELSGV